MADSTILGTTVIADRWRISLIKAVREEFEELDSGIDVGDRMVFKKEDERIVIEPA